MMRWLIHMWQGYLWVQVFGEAPERFFNLCRMQEIELWNLRRGEEGCFCCMTVEGLKRSKYLLRKAGLRLRICRKAGLPFFLYRNRKRKLSAFALLLFAGLLAGMTLFIWDISFEGNHRYTDEMLLDYLREQKIDFGKIKYRISCEELEERLRLDFPDITWVSARVEGTRLVVQLRENRLLGEKAEEKERELPCDLVAEKAGVIVKMQVRSGLPKVKVGETVEEGQLLVEGRVPIVNDAKEEVREQEVVADAEIFARCESQYEESFSLLHEERSWTGRERRGIYLRLFRKAFVWMLPKPQNSDWEVTTQLQSLCIWERFVLPVSFGTIRAREYIPYETWYSEEEAEAVGREKFSEFLSKFTQKGVQILENDVKVVSNGSEGTILGRLSTVEQIALAKERQEPSAEETEEDGGE